MGGHDECYTRETVDYDASLILADCIVYFPVLLRRTNSFNTLDIIKDINGIVLFGVPGRLHSATNVLWVYSPAR